MAVVARARGRAGGRGAGVRIVHPQWRRKPRFLDMAGTSAAEEEWLRELTVGRSVGLWYADDHLWHEMILVWPADGKRWHALSADDDFYIVDLECSGEENGPVRGAMCDAAGKAADELRGKFYRFKGYPEQATFDGYLKQAKEENDRAGHKPVAPTEGLNMAGEQVVLPVEKEEAAAEPPAPEPEKARPGPGKGRGGTALETENAKDGAVIVDDGDGFVWITMEKRGDVEVGTEVKLSKTDPCTKDCGLYHDRKGLVIAVKRVDLTKVATEAAAAAKAKAGDLEDARILTPVRFDKKGKRYQSMADGVARLSEEPLPDFPLEGERSAGWLYGYVCTHGTTFDGRQTKWANEQGVKNDSITYVMHELTGYALEMAIVYDQLDAGNLACLELLARFYMLIEESKGALTFEGYEHFIGRGAGGSLRKGIALAPGIAKFAVDQQSKETEILKQRRKAKGGERGGVPP